MADPVIEIRGGAGPAEAAAIGAAISHLIELEAERSAAPPAPPRLPAWVLAGRSRRSSAPRRTLTQPASWVGLPESQ